MEETLLFHFLDNDMLDFLLILIIVLWSNLSHSFHIKFKSLLLKFSFQLLVLQNPKRSLWDSLVNQVKLHSPDLGTLHSPDLRTRHEVTLLFEREGNSLSS